MTVHYETEGPVATVTIDRPEVANAVDGATALRLVEIFEAFDADPALSVAVLTGAGGKFSAGGDLKAIFRGEGSIAVSPEGPGPLGPTRMMLSKPVIAAVEGHAVAGGLELALWCDLRVAARNATFGVYCRRWGVPLCDGGTVRLPRLIGQSHALDMILTGRGVGGEEAFRMGLVNRLCEPGGALAVAANLAAKPCPTPADLPTLRPPLRTRAVGTTPGCRPPQRDRSRPRGHPLPRNDPGHQPLVLRRMVPLRIHRRLTVGRTRARPERRERTSEVAAKPIPFVAQGPSPERAGPRLALLSPAEGRSKVRCEVRPTHPPLLYF